MYLLLYVLLYEWLIVSYDLFQYRVLFGNTIGLFWTVYVAVKRKQMAKWFIHHTIKLLSYTYQSLPIFNYTLSYMWSGNLVLKAFLVTILCVEDWNQMATVHLFGNAYLQIFLMTAAFSGALKNVWIIKNHIKHHTYNMIIDSYLSVLDFSTNCYHFL